jgi:hypothetical protein
MTTSKSQINEECCPTFHPEKWNEKTFCWNQKPFLIATVPTLFHIPFPPMIGKQITEMMKQAEKAHKLSDDKEEILLLFTDPHPFKSVMLLSITDEVEDANNMTLTGTFLSKVFDGPPKAISKFIKEMNDWLAEEGKKASSYYVHYAYCPKCAKERGHNYMVLFAEIED